MGVKTCYICKDEKPFTEFHRSTRSKDGRVARCKVCSKEYLKNWFQANKEAEIAKAKLRIASDRERHNGYVKTWASRNKDKVLAANRKRRAEKPGVVREYTVRRRAAQLRAVPAWIDDEAVRAVYQEAAHRRAAGEKVHVDHIVPLQGVTVCGLHVQGNLQVISVAENHRKFNRWWPDMPTPLKE